MPQGKLLHLDVQLHGVVLTELAQGGGRLERRRVEFSSEVGLVALHDAWARRIAELFVHATRFDPLHSAPTEQELYHRLPGWLDALCREAEIKLTLPSRRGEPEIEVTRDDVVAAAEASYASVLELVRFVKRAGEPVTVLLSHRLAGLPGLAVRLLELRDVDCIVLSEGAAAVGALHAREAILSPAEEEALPYVLRLPVEGIVGPSPTMSDTSDRVPTHVVDGGLAYPIGEGLPFPCRIYRHDGQVVVDGTEDLLLNGEAAGDRPALAAGDRLRLADLELQLIAVVE